MRDIQDLVILRRTATEELAHELDSARQGWVSRFQAHFQDYPAAHSVGIHVAAIPLPGGGRLHEVDEVTALQLPMHRPKTRVHGLVREAGFPPMGWNQSPILGGRRFSSGSGGEDLLERDAFRNGRVEYRYLASTAHSGECVLYPDWFVVIAYNTIRDALSMAEAIDRIGVEIALSVNVQCLGGALRLQPTGHHGMLLGARQVNPMPLSLSPRAFSDLESGKQTLAYLLRDLHNAAGLSFDTHTFGIEDPNT